MITAFKNHWFKMTDKRSSLQKALDWVKKNRIPHGGVVVHHQTKDVSEEVTGYLIESLYNAGEKEFAFDLARWEASVQRPDGAFVAPGTKDPYTFDTAQVVRGFLAVVDEKPEFKPNLLRACDFIAGQIDATGEVHTPIYNAWTFPDGSKFSDYCNLFVLYPLIQAGRKFKVAQYEDAGIRALNFYKQKSDLVEFKPELGTLSHIFGYMLEALADLDQNTLVKKGLDQAARIQKPDGAIPAYPGVNWVCSTGMAQLGLAWFKTGNREQARRMLDYLEKIQNPSGGFYGSYGKGGQYFPNEEISWANKFFIDLYLLIKGKDV